MGLLFAVSASRMLIWRCAWFVALSLFMHGAAAEHAAPAVRWLHEPALPEISGLVESGRLAGHFWALNDSGNAPELIAFDRAGERRARVQLEGVRNIDWEDLAAFQVDGEPMLAIADCGDNFKRRQQVQLILLPEPDPLQDAIVRPQQVRSLYYPDGARDCEALVAEPGGQRFLLIDKGEPRTHVYATDSGSERLQRIAEIQHRHPQAPPPVLPISGRYRAAVSAADLDVTGSRLLVLTYTHWLVYQRAAGEPWASALARMPISHPLPGIRGLEAAAWGRDGSIWVSGEGQPAPLLHWPPPVLPWAKPARPATAPSAASESESSLPAR